MIWNKAHVSRGTIEGLFLANTSHNSTNALITTKKTLYIPCISKSSAMVLVTTKKTLYIPWVSGSSAMALDSFTELGINNLQYINALIVFHQVTENFFGHKFPLPILRLKISMSSKKNFYEALAKLSLEDPEIEAEILGEEPNGGGIIWKWEVTPFNIDELEKEFGNWRIFTRDFLQQIAKKKAVTETALQEGKPLTLFHHPLHREPGSDEHFAVVVIKDNERISDASVSVRYLTRVELHRDFQELRHTSDSVNLLRDYRVNPDLEWLPVPYVLDFIRNYNDENYPRNIKDKSEWQEVMRRTKKLWEDSAACTEVREAIIGCTNPVRITRIVCFGLGPLVHGNDEDINRVLQHLMVFQLAEMLDKFHQEKDSSSLPVEVLLQDPMYEREDRQLLHEQRDGVKFVQDPYGLLAIDRYTLVIAPFVPTAFPVMQIIADMFEEGQGPAGFLIDNIQRRCTEPGMYQSNDRLSPRAVRMLEHYSRSRANPNDPPTFKKGGLGKELQKQLAGNTHYWMEYMELCMRIDAPASAGDATTSAGKATT